MESLPHKTPRKPSTLKERQSTGTIFATECTTSISLLNANPSTWRKQNRTELKTIASVNVRTITAKTASRAACGLPAPNSFETRLLQNYRRIFFYSVLDVSTSVYNNHKSKMHNMRSISKNMKTSTWPYNILYMHG